MKIAITGGSGFIGKWLLESIPEDIKCIVIGRINRKNNIKIGKRVFDYFSTNYRKEEILKALKDCNAVVHLAAFRAGSNSFDDYLSNIIISQKLFDSCMELGLKNIVALSSISVYSQDNVRPWNEKQYLLPDTFYGISKAAMESIAVYYNRKYEMAIKCLRVSSVIGLGERTGYMLMNFINQAYKKQKLTVFGKGTGRREYVYVKDVVNAIYAALKKEKQKGVFNVGTGKNTSHYELATTINNIFYNKNNLEIDPKTREDTSIYLMNIKKAQRSLGYRTQWSLEKGLKDIKRLMDLKEL